MSKCQVLAGSSHSGNLVSIGSSAENNFVYQTLSTSAYYYAAWIGLRFDLSSSTFIWVDGTDTEYRNWGPGEPSNPYTYPCAEMDAYYDYGTWGTYTCENYDYNYYVCEAELGPTVTYPPVPTSEPGECPSAEWLKRDDTSDCYLVRPNQDSTWFTALEICKALTGGRGSLTSIRDAEENAYITFWADYFADGTDPSIWIGLNKQGYGYPYVWEDEVEVEYLNWGPGEPNDLDGTQNCVRMYPSHADINFRGKWDDYFCSDYYNHGYVCRIPQGGFADLDQDQIDKDYQRIVGGIEERKKLDDIQRRKQSIQKHMETHAKKEQEKTRASLKVEAKHAAEEFVNSNQHHAELPRFQNHDILAGLLDKKNLKESIELSRKEANEEFNKMYKAKAFNNAKYAEIFESMEDGPHMGNDAFINIDPHQNNDKNDIHSEQGSSDTGKVVGSALGVFVGVLVITGAIVVILQRKRKVEHEPQESDAPVFNISVEATQL